MKRILALSVLFSLAMCSATYADGLIAPCSGVFCYGPNTITANAPILGNGSASPTTGSRSGSTTTFATASGSLTTGDCVQLDGNGNFVDAGGPCTTGGGGGTVNSGTAGQLTYYATTGTAVSGNVNANISGGGLTLGQTGSVLGDLLLSGSSTGKVTIQPQAAAGTYNFNLPITAGSSTDVLTSGGGSSSAMTWTSVATTATASALDKRDSNANSFVNNILANATVTVGSGGTTTLNAGSSRYQGLSTAAQTFVLPDATTLSLGPWFTFNNNTAGSLTINKNGGTLQYTVPAGGITQCGPTDISTAAGSWDCHSYLPGTISWGSGTTGLIMNTALSTAPAISGGASSATAPAFKPQSGTSNTGFSGDSTHVYGVVGGATSFTSTASVFNIPSGAAYQINGTQIAASNLSNGVTGSGAVVLASSPSLTTPVLGVASATSAAIGGGSIGSDALEVTGTQTFTGNGLQIGNFSVQSGNTALTVGADSGATTLTTATNKVARIVSPHYTTASGLGLVCNIIDSNQTSSNTLNIGGGTSACYAATTVNFYSAANSTTATGSVVMSYTSSAITLSQAVTANSGFSSSSASITLSGLGASSSGSKALCLNGTTVTVSSSNTCPA